MSGSIIARNELLIANWIAERAFVWIRHCRRSSKDDERTIASSEAMLQSTIFALLPC